MLTPTLDLPHTHIKTLHTTHMILTPLPDCLNSSLSLGPLWPLWHLCYVQILSHYKLYLSLSKWQSGDTSISSRSEPSAPTDSEHCVRNSTATSSVHSESLSHGGVNIRCGDRAAASRAPKAFGGGQALRQMSCIKSIHYHTHRLHLCS